jgi:hypothetical protein
MNLKRTTAVLAVVALAAPAGVLAKGKSHDAGSKGKAKTERVAKGKKGKGHAHGRAKPRTFVFKGTWTADGVAVSGGNARVRKGGFKGTTVVFDLTNAKIRSADANGDGTVDAADLADGDKVVVQAKLRSDTEPGADALPARKVVNQSNPAEQETPEPAEAPEGEQA